MKIKAVHTHTHTETHTHTQLEESSTSKENLLVLNPPPPAGLTSCISLKDLYDANQWFYTSMNAFHSCVWSVLTSVVAFAPSHQLKVTDKLDANVWRWRRILGPVR